MRDKLLVEVEINGDTGQAVRALVFLANELLESSVEITEPVEWRQKINDDYLLKWRFAEDAMSSWQVVINADLAVQLTHALSAAQSALNAKAKRPNDTLAHTLEAIEKVRTAFRDSIAQAEPEMCGLICEA